MNIILIGYRGSGKTSIGRKIADQTWKDFVDTDALVMAEFGGRTIRDIWETDGEPAFRQAEVEVTRKVLAGSNQVIALGGGTVMQPDARQAVVEAEDAKRIYLSCRPAVLAERIAGDASTAGARPDLTEKGGGVEEITAVLEERDPVYREVADAVFDVTYTSIDEAVAHLTRHHL